MWKLEPRPGSQLRSWIGQESGRTPEPHRRRDPEAEPGLYEHLGLEKASAPAPAPASGREGDGKPAASSQWM